MYYIIFFISAFFGFFGFKVYGVIDFMVLVPFLIFLVLIFLNKFIVKAPSVFVFLIFSFFLILVFEFLLFNFNNNIDDLQFVVRLLRGVVSGVSLFFIFYYLISSGRVVDQRIFYLIALVFVICAASVYVQALFPVVQPFFAKIWGFDKGYRYLRAFGLSTGYDTTGYLLSWFSAVTLFVWLSFHRKIYLVLFIFISISVLFTSRTSMVLYVALIFISLLWFFKEQKIQSIKSLFVFTFVFVFSYFFVFPILYYSVFSSGGGEVFMGAEISSRFASTDIESSAVHHFRLPEDLYSIIFGTGTDPHLDPGYIVAIHHGGLFSLLIYSIFYMVFYFLIANKIKKTLEFNYSNTAIKWILVWRFAVFLLLVVIFVGNFKNFYFFTRGYHELFVSMSAIALGAVRYFKNKRI